jgi:hypothetical protein
MSIADELEKLEDLRRRGVLDEAEFARAKAALLDQTPAQEEQPLREHLADQLAEVKHQNELAQVDREWEIERQQYMIADRWGRRHVPTPGMGIAVAVIGGAFGLIWTIMAVAITGSGPDVGAFSIARWAFPLFGIIFVAAAISFGVYSHSRAQKYQQAFEAYKARRARVRPQ